MAQYLLVAIGNIGGATPREGRAMPDLTNYHPASASIHHLYPSTPQLSLAHSPGLFAFALNRLYLAISLWRLRLGLNLSAIFERITNAGMK